MLQIQMNESCLLLTKVSPLRVYNFALGSRMPLQDRNLQASIPLPDLLEDSEVLNLCGVRDGDGNTLLLSATDIEMI